MVNKVRIATAVAALLAGTAVVAAQPTQREAPSGTPGAQTDESAVRAADPDVVIAAWCGAGDRVPLEKIVVYRHWEQTKAARAKRVYCINDEFLNTPGPTLLSGLHCLAAAIHPKQFAALDGLRQVRTEVAAGD